MGASLALTPYGISCIMCRESISKPSLIETTVEKVKASIIPKCSEVALLEVVSQIMVVVSSASCASFCC